MTIRLGLLHLYAGAPGSRAPSGTGSQPPILRTTEEGRVREWVDRSAVDRLAEEQLQCIRRYMEAVGRYFTTNGMFRTGPTMFVRGLQGAEAARFRTAEADAMSLGPRVSGPASIGTWRGERIETERRPCPTLILNLPHAVQGLGNRGVSWVFQRLHDLARNERIIVDLWDTAESDDEHFIGFTGSESQLPVRYIWVMARHRSPLSRGQVSASRGNTYVHELVIHAWRVLRFGPNASLDRNGRLVTRAVHPMFGDHTIAENTSGQAGESFHSLADVEAGLLNLYEQGVLPPHLTGTPRAGDTLAGLALTDPLGTNLNLAIERALQSRRR